MGGTADCFDGLARLDDDPERAGQLVGAAERLRQSAGRRPIRADQPPFDVPATARREGAELPLDGPVAANSTSDPDARCTRRAPGDRTPVTRSITSATRCNVDTSFG